MDVGPGTIVVITGAASGIGRALADTFAAAGCSLVLSDIDAGDLATANSEILETHGVDTMTSVTDVSKADQVDALAQATVDRFGAVHVVCNNAGVMMTKPDPWTGPIESWEWVMNVNFWGVVHGVRAFLPRIIESGGGHIVNTASIAGLNPGLNPAYDASKHAVVAVTEDLYNSMKMSPVPVGVSCLCPAWVRTALFDADRHWPDQLGTKPDDNPMAQVVTKYLRRAIDEGKQPAAVADLVVDAVRADRFWVFPHPEFLEMAAQRFHSIAEGANPVSPEQTPGLPPTEQILAETMELLTELMPQSTPDD
jgi:NAD(P)-dependent dehydrogenase (short-subunit alcohol dehydrogenase family)